MTDKEQFLGRISGSLGTYFGKGSQKIKDFLHNHGHICFCHWPVLGTPKQATSYTPAMDTKVSPSKRSAKNHNDLGDEDGVGSSNVKQEKV